MPHRLVRCGQKPRLMTKDQMTLRDFLQFRRDELVRFFGLRFGVNNWSAALCYTTGLPRWLCRKIRSFPVESTFPDRPLKFMVSVRDILRLEDAARQLGFKPKLPGGRRKALPKPPPANLPAASDPSVRIRFKLWQQRNTINKSERKIPTPVELSEKRKTQDVSEQQRLNVSQTVEQPLSVSNQVL
jgi:hypothetical protein